MTLTIDVATDDVLELDAFHAFVRETLLPGRSDTLLDCAEALRALANHPRFLVDHLNAELSSDAFQAGNGNTAQTIGLGSGPGYRVRANVWMPCDGTPVEREQQRRLYLYEMPHDHNFDFLTVGYAGPGYETDLYECDRASIAGLPGERVHLTPGGREKLERGKVMHYRSGFDVHSQLPPETFSVSLNLIVPGGPNAADQLFYDVERGMVAAPVETESARRAFVCEAARYFGDAETASLLGEIGEAHACPRTRVAALESLAALDPTCAIERWEKVVDDAAPYVRAVARRHLG